MDIEAIREYCLSLPHSSEDMAFGDDCLLLRVCNKIFACIFLFDETTLVLKCDPEYALDLRDAYSGIEPAWHWNKKYWIQFRPSGVLNQNDIKSLIRHSYSEVVKKLPKKIITSLPELAEIQGENIIR